MLSAKIIERIARKVSARPEQVVKTLELFDAGSTIPFVARYRKDTTGALDETKLETISELNHLFTALEQRRASILKNIDKAGKLTDELRAEIEACMDKHRLEDLYLPFKKKRRTKASVAREQGLEPLADRIWAQEPLDGSLEDLAKSFVGPEKGVQTVELALEGARYLLAERVAEDAAIRKSVREKMMKEGKIVSCTTKLSDGKKTKFNAYYDFSEPIRKLPSYRLLAILRGVKEGMLRMELELDDSATLAEAYERYVKDGDPACAEQLRAAIEDAYRRLIRPAIENEVVSTMRRAADEHAIGVFRENAKNLLLAPPAGKLVVLGVDPGLRSGSKLVVTSDTGEVLEFVTIYPEESEAKRSEAAVSVMRLIEKYKVDAIAIGSGTGSREASRFIRTLLRDKNGDSPICVLVNEAGASVYSASAIAREEFPDLDVTIRGAVSIARRLQDPLAELVKIEPRSIGVGQYQHDVNQKQLKEGLHQTVVSCVNQVGVDLNTASVPLLRYVSGVQYGTAQNIVAYRNEKGRFRSRDQLQEVPGVGPRVFEQCAGFLRITDGENALDSTAIHPEAYSIVEKIAQSLGATTNDLTGNRELVEKISLDQFVTEELGERALADIRDELIRPSRDPRKRFRPPKFLEGVEDIKDLETDMEIEGVVSNVTDFGAFVDIGVHQDGLVHLSELANRFVRDPRQVVRVGQVVRVKVLKVDQELPRISLSIKALQPVTKRPPKPKRTHAGAERADAAVQREASRTKRPSEAKGRDAAKRREESRAQKKRRPEKPSKSKGRGGSSGSKPKIHESGEHSPMNTQLADQLESLRQKFGS